MGFLLFYFYSKTNKMHIFLHVSDGLSVHYQDFTTAHTATGICQTDTAVCLLKSRQRYLFDMCLLLYVQS